jgi:periplasmic mercuric ion binding protein
MRGIVYIIAVVVAVGIMISIANLPPAETTAPQATTAVTRVMSEPGQLTFDVPQMHCEFACFPRVKETLEQTAAVESVELAPQQEEGTIDNRQVIVKYQAGFDVAAAVAALSKEGFAKSSVADVDTVQ